MAGAVPIQTQEDLVPPPAVALGYRISGVLLAPAVAAAVHLAVIGPFGIDLQVPESPGSSTLASLPILTTVLVTLGVALAGWLTVGLLERGLGGERGRRIFTFIAAAVFVVSLVPIVAADIGAGARWGLFAMHVAVAAILIPTLASGTAPRAGIPGGRSLAATAQEDTHVASTAHGHPHDPTGTAQV
jgi:hypothetical protein